MILALLRCFNVEFSIIHSSLIIAASDHSSFHIPHLKFYTAASHERCTRHGITEIDLIGLCQQVLATYPEADVTHNSVSNTGAQQVETFFRFIVAHSSIQFLEMLLAQRSQPLALMIFDTQV